MGGSNEKEMLARWLAQHTSEEVEGAPAARTLFTCSKLDARISLQYCVERQGLQEFAVSPLVRMRTGPFWNFCRSGQCPLGLRHKELFDRGMLVKEAKGEKGKG